MSFRTANDLVIDEVDNSADVRSESIDCTYLDGYSMQVVSTGTIAGVLKVEVSNNNEDWVELSSPTIAVANITNDIVEASDLFHRYIRFFYDSTSGTTNTLKIWFTAKGK